MTFSIIVLLLIIVALFKNNSTSFIHNGLIYNGEILNMKKYPYITFIKFLNQTTKRHSLCTGTMVKKLFLLTAAHCCYGFNLSDIEACHGSPALHKPDYHKVVENHVHELFNPSDPTHSDICILKLEKAFPNIKKFSKIGGSPKDFANGKKLNCKVIGFGDTADKTRNPLIGYIMTSDVVYGREACKKYNSATIKNAWNQSLCLVPTNKSRPCPGDSGGPMICNNIQYGVCSYGYPYIGNDSRCEYLFTQTVYMFLGYHDKWLKVILEKRKKKKRSFGNLLKPRHYTLHIFLTILVCNMLTFI